MQQKVMGWMTQVAEFGIFFAAAIALAAGMMQIR
jgi:predicted small integral membrane protein